MTGVWSRLPTDFHSREEVIEAGFIAELLYLRVQSFVKERLTDGRITAGQLKLAGHGIPDLEFHAQELVDVGLWERDGRGYVIVGWFDDNESADAVKARDRARKEAGKAGNHARWKHPGASDTCVLCHPHLQNGRSSHVAIATGSESDPKSDSDRTPIGSPEVEVEVEPEVEVEVDPEPEVDQLQLHSSATPPSDVDATFEQFWQTYKALVNTVRRPAGSKGEASNSWDKLSKVNRRAALFGAERLLQQARSDHTGRLVAPHAVTWLNQKRWMDEGLQEIPSFDPIVPSNKTGVEALNRAMHEERMARWATEGRDDDQRPGVPLHGRDHPGRIRLDE